MGIYEYLEVGEKIYNEAWKRKSKRKILRSDYSIHSKDNGAHQVESTQHKVNCVRGVILFKSHNKKDCEKWIKDKIKGV